AAFGAEAIVHVRHLSVAWHLGVDQLDAPAALGRLADELVRDLVASIEHQPPAARLRPADPAIVLFADEHHRAAASLADAADGRERHWSFAAVPEPAATWAAAAAGGASALATTLRWLSAMERVEPALAFADEPTLAAVITAEPRLAPLVELVRARRPATRLVP